MTQKSTILIVDDEQINLDFFDVMLSRLGFTVVTAVDGEDALEKIGETNPDLIILDNVMPRLSGWEVTKMLKRDENFVEYADIPIIMFSAMDDVKDKIEGFELGIEDYITKPYNFSEVLARIKAVLRNRDLSTQVIQRERRIALIESLNKSLVYFTEHLRAPVLDLLEKTETLDVNDGKRVGEVVEAVRGESRAILATLDGLKDEIAELQSKGDEMKAREVSPEMLDAKYQKHFSDYKERQRDFDEVKK